MHSSVADRAAAMGIQGDTGAIRFDLRRLRELGVFVDVKVEGVTMLSSSTTWDEFGIPRSDIRSQRLRRGRKALVSEEFAAKAHSIAVRIRQNLDAYSFNLSGFAPYRWVPVNSYQEWRAKHDSLEQKLRELAVSYDYDAERLNLARVMRDIAREAYDSMIARGQSHLDPFAYQEQIVADAVAKLPTREQVMQGLRVSYRTAFLEDTADVEARAASLAQAELDQQRIRAESAAVQEMHRMEMERAREQIASMASPWEEMLRQFEQRIAQDVTQALDTIRRSGHVSGRTAGSLRALRETYNLLCVQQSPAIEDAIARIEQSLGERPQVAEGEQARMYNVETVTAALEGMLTVTRTTPAEELAAYDALELD